MAEKTNGQDNLKPEQQEGLERLRSGGEDARKLNDQGTQQGSTADLQEGLQRFCREVKDARELLEFAVSQGNQVLDQTVEEIKKAEEFLRCPILPSWEGRAAFEKAYRDLARLLSPVTAADLRTKSWKECWELLAEWWKLLAIVGSFLFVVLFGLGYGFGLSWGSIIIFAVVGIIPLAFILWGFYIFTGVVTKNKLNQVVLFCYVFTVCALLSSLLPFIAQEITLHSKIPLYGMMIRSAIGIVEGCSEGESPSVPPEIICKGGDPKDGTVSQWVINIAGTIQTTDRLPDGRSLARIRGGLVVPLYFVVLALMGGAVSMTRRVPEYQRRALDVKEPLTNGQAREYLIFQIMQVLSAPLIAITAYYALAPPTRTSSIALGFTSGFASETILLAIRALVEKLNPAEPTSQIQVSPTLLDFGSVTVGSHKDLTFTITNTRDGTLTGSVTGASSYSVVSGSSFSLPAKASQVVTVRFSPTSAGTFPGHASMSSNVGSASVSLSGTGSCTYLISPTSQSLSASDGTGSVNITAGNGCSWTAASNAPWITITSGSSGSGNGTVTYSVAANTSTSSRTGTLTIREQIVTVTQEGSQQGR